MVELINPLLPPIVETVTNAVRTGASMYQAMSLVLACFVHLWDCVCPVLPRIAFLVQDILPIDVIPLRHSVLLQLLISALYTELINSRQIDTQKTVKLIAEQTKAHDENFVNKLQDMKVAENVIRHKHLSQSDGISASTESIALAIAESLCCIDEENKHTEQIDEFLEYTKKDVYLKTPLHPPLDKNKVSLEILSSNLSMTDYGKSSLKVCFYSKVLLNSF